MKSACKPVSPPGQQSALPGFTGLPCRIHRASPRAGKAVGPPRGFSRNGIRLARDEPLSEFSSTRSFGAKKRKTKSVGFWAAVSAKSGVSVRRFGLAMSGFRAATAASFQSGTMRPRKRRVSLTFTPGASFSLSGAGQGRRPQQAIRPVKPVLRGDGRKAGSGAGSDCSGSRFRLAEGWALSPANGPHRPVPFPECTVPGGVCRPLSWETRFRKALAGGDLVHGESGGGFSGSPRPVGSPEKRQSANASTP